MYKLETTHSQIPQKKQGASWHICENKQFQNSSMRYVNVTYAICVAPIRHSKILKLELQAAVYEVRFRRQI